MSEMLIKLGLDGKLFIAQLVNFLILFLVLRAFAWKPLVMALEQRRGKIKQGIANADQADRKLAELEIEREEVLAKARTEALRILDQADQKAQGLKEEKLKMAKQEIESQVNDAKEQIMGERAASYNALKQDIAKLITAATGKIVTDLDEKAHEKLIQAAIQDLEK